jgi:antitoxin (DNA-binding transcriptional repressor) of toxin-antitoxin stability system
MPAIDRPLPSRAGTVPFRRDATMADAAGDGKRGLSRLAGATHMTYIMVRTGGAYMQIAVAEAKAQFAELIRKAEAGEAIVITRYGRPVAELRAASAPAAVPLFGALKGRIEIADDFDDLPPGFAQSLGAPVEPE